MKTKIPIFKGKHFQELKKRNKHWGYPIKFHSTKLTVQAKKKYKDSVFTKLFNNKAAAIQLYNALYHKNLPENTPIEIVTLDDVLFAKRKNDVAFLVDGHFLIFVEHQSTINENMPLRFLLYIVQEYEKLIGYRIERGKQISQTLLYKENLIKIPRPEFFVLYNGTKDLTEIAENGTTVKVTEKLMKLSDAYMESSTIANSLELCVKLIDVRYQSNHQSLHQKKQQGKEVKDNLSLLGEYSYFINKIAEYKTKDNRLEYAIKAAAKHCIDNNILREFLLKNETEVVLMLLGIFDEEIEKQVIREETAERIRKEERAKAKVQIQQEKAKAKVQIQQERAKAIIDSLLDFGHSNEEILATLQKRLQITAQQADEYLRKFYDKTL